MLRLKKFKMRGKIAGSAYAELSPTPTLATQGEGTSRLTKSVDRSYMTGQISLLG